MPVNWVRGFRRIGWVVTFPIAALIVLVFYEDTKEYSPVNYEVTQSLDYDAVVKKYGGTTQPQPGAEPETIVALPGLGRAYFSGEIPKDVMENIIKDFTAKPHSNDVKPWELDWSISPPPPGFVLEKSLPICWKFTVHKQVNKLRLAGLIAGSLVLSALIIQGSISVLAWMFKGFKG